MVKVALFVRLEAKPGKEAEVENLLKNGLSLVQDEPGTAAWFGIRMGRSTFGIFDAFPDEEGREAHLAGAFAQNLMTRTPELFAGSPLIEEVEVLAAKLPEARLLKKPKVTSSKLGAALGVAGIVAAGWYAARRYSAPSTPYEALERAPVTTPM